MNNSPVKNQRKQENLFSRVPKASTELIALTYGALVTKLIKDNQHKPIEEVNVVLEKIGYNMGTRMIDEFFSKTYPQRPLCKTFKETVEVIAKEGFKMFLGTSAEVVIPNKDYNLSVNDLTSFTI